MIENQPSFNHSTAAAVLIVIAIGIYPNLTRIGFPSWGLFAIITLLAAFIGYENWDYRSGRWEKRQKAWVEKKIKGRV